MIGDKADLPRDPNSPAGSLFRLNRRLQRWLLDVAAVFRDLGTAQAAPIREMTVGKASELPLPDGSTRLKVEAASTFVRAGGPYVVIGRLEDALDMLEGSAGTRIIARDDLERK